MADESKRKLKLATIVYWVLLVYIIAALVWWAISLLNQNEDIYHLQRQHLETLPSTTHARALEAIESERNRNRAKYIGEGGTFLLLILIGAVFVYRSVRRQFRVQQQQQNFVMAVTHELKTPIAVSRLNLETLQRYHLDEAKRSKLLQVSLQETLRLDTLINNILISSQLDGNFYKLSKEEIDLSSLVIHALQEFNSRYPERVVEHHIEEEKEIAGDPILLKLLVSNLLENANKYSPKPEPILLNLKGTKKATILEVRDKGSGIPADEKQKVFEKFYRIGNEQTRTAKGTGLGLYLCKKIVQDHGGTIQVEDNQPSGSTFIIHFPV